MVPDARSSRPNVSHEPWSSVPSQSGLNLRAGALGAVLDVNKAELRAELPQIRDHLAQLGQRPPLSSTTSSPSSSSASPPTDPRRHTKHAPAEEQPVVRGPSRSTFASHSL